MNIDEMIEKIIAAYEFENQQEIFVEECAEAIQAVQKFKRAGGNEGGGCYEFEHLVEEVADVYIMAEQMKRYIGTDCVNKVITEKLERQIERIRKEQE